MKVYDCFIFNNENHILDIRLNELDKFVNYFIIIEFGETHQGKKKKQLINKDILKKFEKKIRYFFIEKFEKSNNSWARENFQRNCLNLGLDDALDDDLIIISDVDEIPNLNNFNFNNINDYVFAFSHTHYMYKLNLIRKDSWIGSKLCKKKIFVSPQWLRSLKVHKKYKFYRFDKILSKNYYSKFKIIKNSGWHFGWLKNTNEIIEKLESYAHTEHNIKSLKDSNYINQCISRKISFLNTSEKLIVDKNLDNLPKYISKNISLFKDWII